MNSLLITRITATAGAINQGEAGRAQIHQQISSTLGQRLFNNNFNALAGFHYAPPKFRSGKLNQQQTYTHVIQRYTNDQVKWKGDSQGHGQISAWIGLG